LEVGLDHLTAAFEAAICASPSSITLPDRSGSALPRATSADARRAAPFRRGERCFRGADGQERLVHVDAHLLPQHVELRGGKGEVALCPCTRPFGQPALEQVPGEGDSPATFQPV